ncbi:MAG: hypothetical protein LQ344_003004 [Seirophora lacunosa]|nr:MAG: hypothetical protein LQ344_003004 [Seirophora lacunosa]
MSDNEDCPDPALAASTYSLRYLPSPAPSVSGISSADEPGHFVGEKAPQQTEQHSHLPRSAPSAGWDSDADYSHVDRPPSPAGSAETTRPHSRSRSLRPLNRPAAAFTHGGTLPQLADLNLPTPFQSISDFSLDEMADVAIDVTCQTASQSEDGAGRMWMLWKSYVRTVATQSLVVYKETDGASSYNQAPPPPIRRHCQGQVHTSADKPSNTYAKTSIVGFWAYSGRTLPRTGSGSTGPSWR